MRSSTRHHVKGTRFGIGVDARDGLLRQGEQGYQLTWMDAKVGDWVVTPRRGKAVEINGLWYNALRLLDGWLTQEDGEQAARPVADMADQAGASFNERFWYEAGTISTTSSTASTVTTPRAARTSCSPCRSRTRCSPPRAGDPCSTSSASAC